MTKTREIKVIAVFLCALMMVTVGCGAISSLVGGSSGTKATTLWSDVPAVDGAKQVNLDIPLPIRIAMKAFVTAAANSENSSSDTRLDNFDFIAYTTPKSTEDVKSFYTVERMAAQGWNVQDQPGCAGGDAETGTVAGAFCLFGKESGTQKSILVIVAATEDSTKETQLWYARFEGVSLKTN
jgi:uncharacterized protein YceK